MCMYVFSLITNERQFARRQIHFVLLSSNSNKNQIKGREHVCEKENNCCAPIWDNLNQLPMIACPTLLVPGGGVCWCFHQTVDFWTYTYTPKHQKKERKKIKLTHTQKKGMRTQPFSRIAVGCVRFFSFN